MLKEGSDDQSQWVDEVRIMERAFGDIFWCQRFNSKRTTYGKDLKALILKNLKQLKKDSAERTWNLPLKFSVSIQFEEYQAINLGFKPHVQAVWNMCGKGG